MATKLQIKYKELGNMEANGAFKGQEATVTPLIRKVQLQVEDNKDYKDFHVSPLLHQNVILGAPWFYKKYAKLEYPFRSIVFVHIGTKI